MEEVVPAASGACVASINVDFGVTKDPRIKRLGTYLCTNKFDAQGRLDHVWIECTERGSAVMLGEDIDAVAEHDGFSDLMVKANLAEELPEGLFRVKGCEGRIEWLAEKREAAKRGGEANKKRWEAKREPDLSQTLARPKPLGMPLAIQVGEPEGSPSTSSSASSSSSASTKKKEEELNLPKGSATPRAESKTVATWEAYRFAYEKRYGVPPVRNATVNAQLAQFVKRLGEEESPLVAESYVAHNDSFYVRSGHPVGLMLKDAEKLRTEHFRKKQITGVEARQIERKQATMNAFGKLLAEAEAKESGNG